MDWIAGTLELIALYIIGNKNKYGFLLNLIVGICWITHVCINKESFGLLIVVVPALFINSRNFLKWKQRN